MPRITVVRRDGSEVVVLAEVGRSLMESLRDAGVAEILALCGGCCICGTCHVHVDPAYFAHLEPLSPDEDDVLEGSADRHPHSRLSCQLRVTDAFDGLRVSPAAEGLAFAHVAPASAGDS